MRNPFHHAIRGPRSKDELEEVPEIEELRARAQDADRELDTAPDPET